MGVICYLNKELFFFFFLKNALIRRNGYGKRGMFFTPVFLTSEVISPALTK